MGTYTIREAAERSGFTPSALRYYEGIGLVSPATRTAAGYRVYDDRTLARLAFIARAKQLGCSLEEITDLVGIWDGEQCGPVQRRFHHLVTTKIGAAQRHVAELTAFTSQLQAAAAQLHCEPVDGPCGPDCACLADAEPPTPAVSVALTAKPADPPIACTLEAGAMPERLAAWETALAHAVRRARTDDGGMRIEFGSDVPLTDLAQLVAAEQRCCTFFSFALTIDARGTGLEVRAPEGAEPIVASLFGEAA